MQYTHEHREIQNTLKRFIEAEINPHVDEWEAAEIFPAHEVFKKMGNLGLLGLTKPEAFGGAGLDYSYSLAMAEALGHIDCGGIPMAIGVQTDMATPALARFGSDELRAQFLAPAIDGASPWRRFWTIVFPLLSPTTFFLLVINIVYAFFDTFAIVDATTHGGPGKDTAILVYKVYYDGFKALDMGSSAAQSVVLMVIVVSLTVLQFKFVEKKVQY
eukprot:gene15695-17937_t